MRAEKLFKKLLHVFFLRELIWSAYTDRKKRAPFFSGLWTLPILLHCIHFIFALSFNLNFLFIFKVLNLKFVERFFIQSQQIFIFLEDIKTFLEEKSDDGNWIKVRISLTIKNLIVHSSECIFKLDELRKRTNVSTKVNFEKHASYVWDNFQNQPSLLNYTLSTIYKA